MTVSRKNTECHYLERDSIHPGNVEQSPESLQVFLPPHRIDCETLRGRCEIRPSEYWQQFR
jgi:hypothetical protein